MSAVLLTLGQQKHSSSLLCLEDYRKEEKEGSQLSVERGSGLLKEWHTLELRLNPPQISIDNESGEATILCIDSANRAGTLIEVVQHMLALALQIRKARISSDGGWFVDVFEVTEANGDKVRNERKLQSIKQMLSLDDELCYTSGDEYGHGPPESTVIELAGPDRAGKLAEVTRLLVNNGCDVRSAAVWTYNGRVAFVVSVLENAQPIGDELKTERLRQILLDIMDVEGDSIVNIKRVRGHVHHDRRLHQMMLHEDCRAWDARHGCSSRASLDSGSCASSMRAAAGAAGGCASDPLAAAAACELGRGSPTDSASSLHADCGLGGSEEEDSTSALYRSPKHSKPSISVVQCRRTGYWLVTIACKDRNKLLFDTVCTLADMDYDVYHATVNLHADGTATQEFYVKPRWGHPWDAGRADKLAAMLRAAIQRRFPKGLKVHVQSVDRFGCLAALTAVLRDAGLTITRAKVKTNAASKSSGHTFYVMDASGAAPSRDVVEAACAQVGGQLVDAGEEGGAAAAAPQFAFSFLGRQWQSTWTGGGASGASPGSSAFSGSA